MNAKIARFETLAGITGRVRDVLDWADAQCDMEFQRMQKEEFMEGLNADLKKRFHAIGCDEKGAPFAAQKEEEEEE